MTPDPSSAASPGALIAFTFPYVVALSLCMARPMGIALVLPVFTRTSMGAVPAAGFSFALALPILGTAMEGLRAGGAADALTLALVAGKEVLAGALLGLLFGIPVWSVQSAGELFDAQRGATSGGAAEPGTNAQMGTSAALLSLSAITLFVASGGLGLLAETMYGSYAAWPLFSIFPVLDAGATRALLLLADHLVRVMFVAASPVVIAMLVTDTAVVLVARSVPKLNMFDLGPTLKNLVFVLVMVLYAVFLMDFTAQELAGTRGVASQFRALLAPAGVP